MAERTIPLRLSDFADLLDAQQAPHDLVLHLRAAADEIKRLRERTEYWPDNAERDAVIRHQKEEIERLRAALELFACDCIESGNLCPSPHACRNYVARAALDYRKMEGRT